MTLYLLNLADLALTLYALHHDGVELNPLLQNPTVMVAWKTVGVGLLCYLLHHFRDATKLIPWGLRLCTAVYAAVCVYHFYFVFGGQP